MPRKLAVCMPIHRTTEGVTALCLARLVRHETARGMHVEVFGMLGAPEVWARNELAKIAIQTGCDWTLWIDSDMTFPEDAAEHMLKADLPFVAANCFFRDGTRMTAEKYGQIITTKPDSTGRESVDHIGLAVALIKTELFEKTKYPWFDTVDTGEVRIGCDHYFCRKLRDEQGIRPHIDHDLSKLVSHYVQIPMPGVSHA